VAGARAPKGGAPPAAGPLHRIRHRGDGHEPERLGGPRIRQFAFDLEVGAEVLTTDFGAARTEARLVHLRDTWAQELLAEDRIRLNTSLEPGFAAGIANVAVDGIEPGDLAGWLFQEHRIIVTPIGHPDCRGLRISPSVYTTMEELERFVEAMRRAVRYGIA